MANYRMFAGKRFQARGELACRAPLAARPWGAVHFSSQRQGRSGRIPKRWPSSGSVGLLYGGDGRLNDRAPQVQRSVDPLECHEIRRSPVCAAPDPWMSAHWWASAPHEASGFRMAEFRLIRDIIISKLKKINFIMLILGLCFC